MHCGNNPIVSPAEEFKSRLVASVQSFPHFEETEDIKKYVRCQILRCCQQHKVTLRGCRNPFLVWQKVAVGAYAFFALSSAKLIEERGAQKIESAEPERKYSANLCFLRPLPYHTGSPVPEPNTAPQGEKQGS
jgi:hypothetical protein